MRIPFALVVVVVSLTACAAAADAPPEPGAVKALLAKDLRTWAAAARKVGATPYAELPRFPEKPRVVLHESTAADGEDLWQAILILNEVLPTMYRLQAGRDDGLDEDGFLARGTIHVAFGPRRDWPEGEEHGHVGALISGVADDAFGVGVPLAKPGDPAGRFHAGVIIVDSTRIRRHGKSVVDTLLHEFLHVFGRMHSDGATIMNHDAPPRLPRYLYPLDIAALQSVYGHQSNAR